MFRNIRKTIVSLLSAATLLLIPVAVPAVASAAPNIQDCLAQGSTLTTANGTCSDNGIQTGTDNINNLITSIINIFSVIVGIVAVIMIIVGGFRYITSNGDSNNVSAAKNTIIYAVIGLIIVAFAQFIVQFVLNKVNS